MLSSVVLRLEGGWSIFSHPVSKCGTLALIGAGLVPISQIHPRVVPWGYIPQGYIVGEAQFGLFRHCSV